MLLKKSDCLIQSIFCSRLCATPPSVVSCFGVGQLEGLDLRGDCDDDFLHPCQASQVNISRSFFEGIEYCFIVRTASDLGLYGLYKSLGEALSTSPKASFPPVSSFKENEISVLYCNSSQGFPS